MEVRNRILFNKVSMICPSCSKGEMLYVPERFDTIWSPKFEHICNKCGQIERYDKTYPYNEEITT